VNIPDLISPINAYRTWQWDAEGLKSLNHALWVPGEAMTAICQRITWLHRQRWTAGIPNDDGTHESPADGCTCGVYAAKNFKHLVQIGYAQHGIHGEVQLWGRVWDHHLGYRAQFAYPKNLIIPEDMLPFPMNEIMPRLEHLMLYGVDIFLTNVRHKIDKPILLWSKTQGTQDAGVDFLLRRGAKWYQHRSQKRDLQIGDRVAVKGQGIAIVEKIEGDSVTLALFLTNLLSVQLPDIKWDEHNYRWAAEHVGYVRVVPRSF
jgi:hypothetical protein